MGLCMGDLLPVALKGDNVLNQSARSLYQGAPDEVDVIVWTKVSTTEGGDIARIGLRGQGFGDGVTIGNGDGHISSQSAIFI